MATEWQRSLSGVHSIMREKLVRAGVGGEVQAHPLPFHHIYHHVQSCGVRSSCEGKYTPLFLLYPYMYSVGPWPPPETFLTFLTGRNVTSNFYTAGATEERRLEPY
jgi:hypothetical protein